MKKIMVAVLLLMLAAQPIPVAETTRLSKLLPEVGPGATAKPAQFYSSNLYQYIDGAAEAFHMYGMVAMVHRDYKAKGSDITVDIYDMGDPLNAFGMYAAERSPDYNFIPIGAEGYASEQTLNFLQGPFYVKMAAFGESPRTLLDSFAEGISDRIGIAKSMPAVLALFPVGNLVAHSEKLVKKAPLGHDFLAPALTATYKFNGKESMLVISLAKTAFTKLRNHFGKSAMAAPEFGPNVYRAHEMVFLARGGYTVLFVSPPPDAVGLVKQCLARIPEK